MRTGDENLTSFQVTEFTGKTVEEMVGAICKSIDDALLKEKTESVSAKEMLSILIRLNAFVGELQKREKSGTYIRVTDFQIITTMRDFFFKKNNTKTTLPKNLFVVLRKKLEKIAEHERNILRLQEKIAERERACLCSKETHHVPDKEKTIPEVIEYSSQYLPFLRKKIAQISEINPEKLKENIYIREFLTEANAILKYIPGDIQKKHRIKPDNSIIIPKEYEKDFREFRASIREIVVLIHDHFGKEIILNDWITSYEESGINPKISQNGSQEINSTPKEIPTQGPTERRVQFFQEKFMAILKENETLEYKILETLENGKGKNTPTEDMNVLLAELEKDPRISRPFIRKFINQNNLSEPVTTPLPWYQKLLGKKPELGENDFWKDGRNANITALRDFLKKHALR